LIYFESGGSGGAGGVVVGRQIRKWDENVAALALEVENITSMLQSDYPDFVASHLVT